MKTTDKLELGVSTEYALGLHKLQFAQERQDWIRLAAQEYLDRQSRKSHPQGHFDSAGRWYSHKSEYCECCRLVRAPSRRYPSTLEDHCRTARHVARLYDVTRGELLAMAQTL